MGSKRRRGQPAEADAQASAEAQTETQTEAATIIQNSESQHGQGNDEAAHPSKKARVEKSRTLFVRSLPPTTTADTLTEFFSQHFPVKHATVILDPKTKTSRGYGFVTFTDADDARDAKERLQKEKIDGRPLILDLAEPRHRQGPAAAEAVEKKQERQNAIAEARKAPKLIVRNLPWSIKTSAQLEALFRSYGKVKFADLPQNKGKLSGFGFITMRGHKNAKRAMEMVNGKVVDGRTLAVDWAVDKKQWEQQTKGAQAPDSTHPVQKSEADDASSQEGGEGEEKDGEKDDEEEEEDDDDMDEDLKNFLKNHMQNLEEEDSDPEDPEADEDEDEDEDESESMEASAPKKAPSTDNSTTVFIRNLPFTTTDEQLKAHFELFGRVRYARVVVDRATDRPAGTGFVCFASADDSKACLRGAPRPQPPPSSSSAPKKHQSILQDEAADPEGRYTIEGRILQVSQAVSRDEATRLAETGAAARAGKSDQDKRRLYLLSEGTVPAGSALHSVLSASEIQMREQSTAQRKRLIQGNPSLHLSLTRLAVRNIPREVGPKELKALAREAVVGFARDVKGGVREGLSAEEKARGGEADREAERRRREKGRGVVAQAKVVFENRQGSKVAEGAEGGGRSRGYGFIEYTSHRWALMGLRWLNGHALRSTATGKTQRLIVEFAIENAQVVNRRRELQARSRAGAQRKGDDDEEVDRRAGDGAKGKDFSVSKGKWQPKTKNGKTAAAGNDDEGNGGGEGVSARDALQQKIIARKRMTRKKKAQTRRP